MVIGFLWFVGCIGDGFFWFDFCGWCVRFLIVMFVIMFFFVDVIFVGCDCNFDGVILIVV